MSKKIYYESASITVNGKKIEGISKISVTIDKDLNTPKYETAFREAMKKMNKKFEVAVSVVKWEGVKND